MSTPESLRTDSVCVWAPGRIAGLLNESPTHLDTYERIIEDDAKTSAIVVAAAVYQLAMRDDMLPRFAKADMPPKPANDQPAGGQQAQPATPAAGNGSSQRQP